MSYINWEEDILKSLRQSPQRIAEIEANRRRSLPKEKRPKSRKPYVQVRYKRKTKNA